MEERKRRSYPEAFRLEALALLGHGAESAHQIEEGLGITQGLLLKWQSAHPPSTAHHPARSTSHSSLQPPQPGFCRPCPRPQVGERHHLHRHRRRLAVSGRGPGSVFSQGGGLGDGGAYGSFSGATSLAHGGLATLALARPIASLGSRQSIHECCLPARSGSLSLPGLYEPRRQLLRQCCYGKLLRHPQYGMRLCTICHTHPSPFRHLRVHRSLVQSSTFTLHPRLSQPPGVRTKIASIIVSTKTGQVQSKSGNFGIILRRRTRSG